MRANPLPLLGLLALLLCLTGIAGGAELRTYVLNTLNGDSVAEVVRPMLPEGATVVPYQGRLVLRTTPENYAEIVALLAEVDTPPSSLRISLRRREDSSRQDNAVRGSGAIRYPGGLEGNVRIIREHQVTTGQQDYNITTLDDHEAFIDRGSLIAITGGWPANTTLLPMLQGLEVTPRLQANGDVRLQVQQRHDERRQDGTLSTQHSATTLIVPPGQWRNLGNLGSSESRQSSGLTGAESSQSESSIPLQIRVDVLD